MDFNNKDGEQQHLGHAFRPVTAQCTVKAETQKRSGGLFITPNKYIFILDLLLYCLDIFSLAIICEYNGGYN